MGRKQTSCLPSQICLDHDNFTTNKEKADAFNTFLTNIAKKLIDSSTNNNNNHQIDDTPHYNSFMKGNCTSSMFFRHVTSDEILIYIQGLKPSSPGFDNISTEFLKTAKHIIASPLAHIINISLTTGCVPNVLKIAKVIPIFKTGVRNDIKNYRLISILPVFSKDFRESCI